MTYGKSMYGGWYAHNSDWSLNLNAETLMELKELAIEHGYELEIRWDNI